MGTLLGCGDIQTEWELFGVPFPIIRSFEIDPLGMAIGWYDGCNYHGSSLWFLLGGVLGLILGAGLTIHELLRKIQTAI